MSTRVNLETNHGLAPDTEMGQIENTKPKKPDFILCIPVVILLGLGMIMVYSASTVQSMEYYGDGSFIFVKQLLGLLIGFIGLLVTMFLPHHHYRRKSLMYCALLVVFALLVGVIFQSKANGAHRWYYFGGFGFQPSDLAKVVLIMFVAAYATTFKPERGVWLRRLKYIVPVIVIFCGLFLLQPDFGTTIVTLAILGIMLFLAGMPMRFLVLGGLLLLPIMAGLVVSKSYRMERLKSYLFSEHYQNKQARLAVGSGGVTGVGLGRGKQKLYFLPEPHTDFIFATLCEEFGLVGATALLLAYLFFLLRGIFILKRVPSSYSRILGSSVLLLLIVQALVNVSVALGLFPNKGLTLPFISAGGTALIISLVMAGILLNISRYQIMENRVAE